MLPPPSDPAKNAQLAQLTTAIAADYNKYKYHRGDKDLSFEDMANIMADSRDPEELLEIWTKWHDVGPALRDRYSQIIQCNAGARRASASRTSRRCGRAATTCRRTRSPPRPIGCTPR